MKGQESGYMSDAFQNTTNNIEKADWQKLMGAERRQDDTSEQ